MKKVEDYIRSMGGVPTCKGYEGFPASLCTSINDEVVQINNVTDNVTLDSKLLLCLNSDGTNKSKDMIGNFPLFEYDLNTISWTGNVTKIEDKDGRLLWFKKESTT